MILACQIRKLKRTIHFCLSTVFFTQSSLTKQNNLCIQKSQQENKRLSLILKDLEAILQLANKSSD